MFKIVYMEKIIFPISNGIVLQSENKKVVATVSGDGNKKLVSFKDKNKVIFFNFPFLRGIQYFFCGLFALLKSLYFSYAINDKNCFDKNSKNIEQTKSKKKNKIKQKKLKINEKMQKIIKKNAKNSIFNIFFIFLGILFAAIFIGFIPGKIAYLIVDFRGKTILRNFIVILFKEIFFIIFILFLRIFPSFCEFLRFNRAGDIVLFLGEKLKKQKCPARATNFLNFFVFVFILDFAMVSLIGASFGFVLNLLFHFAIFVFCVSVGYEILLLLDRFNLTRNLAYITAILVYEKPSTTHLETAYIGWTEINLLLTQKDREFMDNSNRAFSVVYSEVRERLLSAGVSDKSETDWLIATILGKNRAEIKLVSSVTEKQYQDIMKATARRAKGESLDNIFGYTQFYGLRFDVNKKVLTPRMETEILVENVLKIAKTYKKPEILDIGTGSGAIAIAVAKNCNASVTAVDISKSALTTAQQNAKKNDVKIEFLHSNLFEGLKRKRKFDIIVSNPPYIRSDEIKNLDKNVRECDPLLALDGGEDGLDYYRQIVPASLKRLTNGGFLMFEIGKGQGAAVRKIMRENGFEEIKTVKDYNKIERIVFGKFTK